jgi:hypothetical protein|tara:strand:+ start:856 stop:1278 length:423 start_codon:yes stop_codon:yes gene_type:complete
MAKKMEYHSYLENGQMFMACKDGCGTYERVDEKTIAVRCWKCVTTVIGFPTEKKAYKPTGRPAGWHFMNEFVDSDGNVFFKGKEQPKLKGTLSPTKVEPKKKTKRRSKEEILLAREADKKTALKKAVQKQKDFLNHKFGD